MEKKYVTILLDGMADYENESGRTPMLDADKPMLDSLAAKGEVGLVQTVPAGMKPGSDVANLSVMGYAPDVYYTGRSPLEALSIGVKMNPEDVSYRCNIVTLSDDADWREKTMIDYSSGEITTPEARELVEYLAENLNLPEDLKLYAGVSYRHCLLRKNGNIGMHFTPPHDISGKKIGDYLPTGEYAEQILELMKQSEKLLKNHPVNKDRIARGLNPATSIWLWGEGRKPALADFFTLRGKKGAVISAVDLLKGIGIAANMEVIDVEGATGTIHTNFDGKAAAAIDALKTNDFVYVHLEAPDECGHQGNYAEKTESISLIDKKIVTPIVEYLRTSKIPFRLAALPDHATPICKKTHVSDPVPYLIYDSENEQTGAAFDEKSAAKTGNYYPDGVSLVERFLG